MPQFREPAALIFASVAPAWADAEAPFISNGHVMEKSRNAETLLMQFLFLPSLIRIIRAKNPATGENSGRRRKWRTGETPVPPLKCALSSTARGCHCSCRGPLGWCWDAD